MSVPDAERTPDLTPPAIDGRAHAVAPHLEVIDRAVQDIFTLALAISSARSLTGQPAAARLDAALEHLDGVVQGLRHLALASYAADPQSRVAAPSHHASTGTAEFTVLAPASNALASVDATLTRLWADAVAADGHGSTARQSIADATRLVRLARLALTTVVGGQQGGDRPQPGGRPA
jgi:hypothetical protein